MATTKDDKVSMRVGVMNGDASIDFYQKGPCTVGYSYVRFEVTGTVKGCCIAKHHLGRIGKESWQEIWNSRQYEAFRTKMRSIHKTHFHLKDPEWGFCQQCSHLNLNEENFKVLQTPYDEEPA